MERPEPFISRVRLKNYKSIAECDVRLGPLTILVGPNGSGKSNFIEALSLLARALSTTPYEAVTELGGLVEIVRRTPESAESFSIDIEAMLPWGAQRESWVPARYGFELGSASRRGLRPFEVVRESCELRLERGIWEFSVSRGVVREEGRIPPQPGIEPDRLYLPLAANQGAHSLSQGLANMRFYSFALDSLRGPAPPSEGAVLQRSGGHLADVLSALANVKPDFKRRIDMYLSAVAPGIESVDPYSIGGYMTVKFKAGAGHERIEFSPTAVSDGTIRAAAVLASLFQLAAVDGRIPLVGIEEPEIALHPAAAGVLFDALTEASEQVQVVVTTQSPDLLDRDDLDISSVRAVSMEDGVTHIGEIDEASRRIVKDHLYTLGELMRSNQLAPEVALDAEGADA
jgi:predicted ATPase